MLPVYLCEDDSCQLVHLQNVTENCILYHEYNMKVVGAYHTPSDLLQEVQKEHPIHGIYILDIELKADINGIELAALIRKLDPRAFIIFITTHDEMAFLTFQYKVEPLDYILKEDLDNLYDRLNDCLVNVLEKQRNLSLKHTDKFCFTSGSRNYFIPHKDIYYIETMSAHKYRVHYANGILELRGNLTDVADRLGKDFCMCHRSCLVNLNHVKELNQELCTVTLDNQISCLCSKRRFGIIKKLIRA